MGLVAFVRRKAPLYIAHLRQHCHNSKCVIFQEGLLKMLEFCNVVWLQRQNNCSAAASLANCIMTLYLLKEHLQTFLSIPITQKYQILSCDTLVANEAIWADTEADENGIWVAFVLQLKEITWQWSVRYSTFHKILWAHLRYKSYKYQLLQHVIT